MKYIKKYESETYNSVEELRDQMENELSKYLRTGFTEDFKGDFNINNNKYLIFLLDDDYGLRIANVFYLKKSMKYTVSVVSIKYNKDRGMFTNGSLGGNYMSSNDITLEEFVKKLVGKLKTQDRVRKLQRKNRELKKSAKKYNI